MTPPSPRMRSVILVLGNGYSKQRNRDIIVSCSKLSDLWQESDLETRQRIQKLTFPKGIFGDKEKSTIEPKIAIQYSMYLIAYQ